MSKFVHLHCHSEYSIKNSTISINKLITKASELNFKTIAITDEFNLFAGIKFYKAAINANVKPIFGCEILVEEDSNRYKLLLLCKNYDGYLNLCELISKCYLEHQSLGVVVAPFALIKQYNKGLIAISLPIYGDIAKLLLTTSASDIQLAKTKANTYGKLFPNSYYIAVQRINHINDESYLQLAVQLATETNTPVVAINAVQFLTVDDFYTHEVKVCIADGTLVDDDKRQRNYTKEQYLKSPKQMQELFSDLPEAIENSYQIAIRCNVKFKLYEGNYLPKFPTPNGLTEKNFFISQSKQGLKKRLKNTNYDIDIYNKRLEYELDIIIKMGFVGYFLIVYDFIKFSRKSNIPVGPGRGSGAGSLVAYALFITSVDPIKYNLLFERFLNPQRVSMPDFDIDFCTNRRDEVIAFVAEKYGLEKVSQIITYGTMAAKGVVRDVGRVLGHAYGFSDYISKLIPNDLKMTLDKALQESAELKLKYDNEEDVKNLIDIAKDLEGLARNIGTHAGGVVIAPSKISDFCPIYKGVNDADSIVSQFDKDDIEAMGLVKFDFLGLSNLTVIDKTINILFDEKITKNKIDLDNIALNDPKVYELLQKVDTTGVFQLESSGMRAYLKKLQADNFNDIVDMLALYRPGSMDYIDDYIDVKHNKKQAEYPHPLLKKILKPTNGVFVYQEQVMQAAQIMAGFSLGAADLLRRAMGKKKPEEMAQQRSVFISGAKNNNISKNQANTIFDYIDKFAGYGFNKSHSVAYALISYQTAFLKSHYPAAFMSAVLSSMMNDTDRIATTIAEIKKMAINIIAPNINISKYEFTIKEDSIVYGLGAIKGLGQILVDKMAQIRANNLYTDLVDFCCRIDKQSLNKRVLEALIFCGAFDAINTNRYELLKTYPLAMKRAEQYQQDQESGQGNLFANNTIDDVKIVQYKDIAINSIPWALNTQLKHEKGVMGYYFSSHPCNNEKQLANNIQAQMPSNINYRKNSTIKALGLVSQLRYYDIKDGQSVFFSLEDASSKVNVIINSNIITNREQQIKDDDIVVVEGSMSQDFRENWQIKANTITTSNEIKISIVRLIIIIIDITQQKNFINLKKIITQYPGNCKVYLQYYTKEAVGIIPINDNYKVLPNDELQGKIKSLLGKDSILLKF